MLIKRCNRSIFKELDFIIRVYYMALIILILSKRNDWWYFNRARKMYINFNWGNHRLDHWLPPPPIYHPSCIYDIVYIIIQSWYVVKCYWMWLSVVLAWLNRRGGSPKSFVNVVVYTSYYEFQIHTRQAIYSYIYIYGCVCLCIEYDVWITKLW